MKILTYILNRLNEPSTWTAIGVIVISLGLVTETEWSSISGGVIALLGVFFKEGNNT